MTLGKRLKQLREERGLTQAEVAKILGVAQNSYANYENEIRTMSDDAKGVLADYFDVTIDFLVGRSNSRRGHASVLTIREALDDREFVAWVKERLLAAQDVAEKVLGEQASPARKQYEAFEKLSRDAQIKILEKGCSEVVKTSDGKFKLVSTEINPNVADFVRNIKGQSPSGNRP